MQIDDHASRNVEAEPDSGSHIFGREERLEHALTQLRRNARAIIAEFGDDLSILYAGPNRDDAARRHGIDGVVDQVGPHLIEITRIGTDTRHGIEDPLDGHALAARAPFEQRDGAVDALADIDVHHSRASDRGWCKSGAPRAAA